MKFPYRMLLDFVDTRLDADAVGDLLTMAGFELEGIEDVEGDRVLDIKVMANRGDALSVFGLAREVLAKDPEANATELYRRAIERFPASDHGACEVHRVASVRIETSNCTRYACRVFEGLSNGGSPDWVQLRLRQAGQRPISLLVDLTNYVMLELGQPLHAFDLDTLGESTIVVRQAAKDETLTTLDEREHKLQPHHMMICDANKPVAIAGVMGGAETEVHAGTTRCLLESAHFVNTSVRKTRKQLGFNTEASYRFERSVDPEGVVAALNRFMELLGVPSLPGVIDHYPLPPIERRIECRVSRAQTLLGMPISEDQAREYLSRLGFAVLGEGDVMLVAVPSWRPDIHREIDVVEEIGRVHGYEKIPEALPAGSTPRGGVFGLAKLTDRAREALVRCGFTQTMSHSMRDRHPLDFSTDHRIGPRNPHSPETAFLRDSLLPGLAEAALRNGGKDLHLFETGRVFARGELETDESSELAILSTGALAGPHWAKEAPAVADFFSLKGVVEELMHAVHIQAHFDYARKPDRRFHPTRQAGLLVDAGKLWVGTVGQIHPDVAEELGLPELTVMAELDLFVLAGEPTKDEALKQFSRNPAVRRDMAFVIDKAVPYAQISESLEGACGDLLEKHWLFDVYEGKGIPEGAHSLAVAIQLRKMGGNLTDAEANEVRDRAVTALEGLGAKLR